MIRAKRQQGFIMMLLLVIMVVGAATYFGNFYENYRFQRDREAYLSQLDKLNRIKQSLMTYMLLQPEIFRSELSSNTVTVKSSATLPGPGYLPCPDDDGDGEVLGAETTCGNPRISGDNHTGFDIGFLPTKISTRNFFLEDALPAQYYYVVADRFVTANASYNAAPAGNSKRYAPLNSQLKPAQPPTGAGDPPGLADNTPPWLEVDGKGPYVALIIAPGPAQTFANGQQQNRSFAGDAKTRLKQFLDRREDVYGVSIAGGDNQDWDRFFFSRSVENGSVNDLIVGITFAEWKEAMKKRIERQKTLLCQIPPEEPHWFNDYDATNNPVGSNWRGVAGCP